MEKDIRKAIVFLREHNNTIPSEVIEFMKITALETWRKFEKETQKKLFDGAKVKCPNGTVKTIFVLPEGKRISEAVSDGSFDINTHVEYETVMLNKTRFKLVED